MRKLIVYITLPCIAMLLSGFITLPVPADRDNVHHTASLRNSPIQLSGKTTSALLYDLMHLDEKGLSKHAFEFAYKGYQQLLKRKLIKPGYLTICDFSQSSKQKRLYLIDLDNNQLLINTYVAHGKNSGGEYARIFSNKSKSLQSSLGFYSTKNIYTGEHGLSLRVAGLEPGFNDKAFQRAIVIHGADYIEDKWMQRSNVMGRSYGCPAVPKKECNTIINTIKNGTCLFIYHPSAKYLKKSKILND